MIKVLPPLNPSAIDHFDSHFICCKNSKTNGFWRIVQGGNSLGLESVKKTLTDHDLKNGHIESIHQYQIFPKNNVEILTNI